MSQINVRAWDKQDKRMIVDEQDFIPLLVTNKGVFRLNPHHQEPLWVLAEEDRFELMLGSGLKDKSGYEIYAGDIRKWEQNGMVIYSVVKFEDGAFWNDDHPLVDCLEDEVTVGNIYEHGDLLGK